jgi:hypothetical protein
MSIREKIKTRMDTLETALKAGKHLSNPDEVTDMIYSISKFWSILDGEHRDFLNAARYAIEEQVPWS